MIFTIKHSINNLYFLHLIYSDNGLDKVILLWTANTERFADLVLGLNDTADNLMRSIKSDASEIAPSTLFAVASILEGVSAEKQKKCFLYILLTWLIISITVRIY